MSQYDLMLYLKIKVDHCDLYFMDQLLYLEDYTWAPVHLL